MWYSAGFAVGGWACYKIGYVKAIPWAKKEAKDISRVLSNSPAGKHSLLTSVANEPLKVEQLGELGKHMIDLGAPVDLNVSRFIVIGDPFKK